MMMMARRTLLIALAHLADFIRPGKSERVQDARQSFREIAFPWVARREEYVARTDVDAAARNGGPGPNRPENDFLKNRPGIGVQRHEPVADSCREIRHAVGERDPRGDRIADVGE